MNLPFSTQSIFNVLASLLIVTGLILFARWSVYRWVGKSLFPFNAIVRITPADAGLKFEDFLIPSTGNRKLNAWYVPAAGDPNRPSVVLIYTGNNQTMSDWVPALAYLWRRGISCMVYDYAGAGASSSPMSITDLNKDAEAACLAFLERVPARARKYLIGSSVGVGPLLEAAISVGCEVDGVFFIAPFVSAREALTRLKGVPHLFSFLIPEVFQNLKLVQRLCVPLILIHSLDDEVFPVENSERIYSAAREPKYLVLLHGLRHRDMLQGKEAQYLAPVADLINK